MGLGAPGPRPIEIAESGRHSSQPSLYLARNSRLFEQFHGPAPSGSGHRPRRKAQNPPLRPPTGRATGFLQITAHVSEDAAKTTVTALNLFARSAGFSLPLRTRDFVPIAVGTSFPILVDT